MLSAKSEPEEFPRLILRTLSFITLPFSFRENLDVCSVPRTTEQVEQDGTTIGVFARFGRTWACPLAVRSGCARPSRRLLMDRRRLAADKPLSLLRSSSIHIAGGCYKHFAPNGAKNVAASPHASKGTSALFERFGKNVGLALWQCGRAAPDRPAAY